MLIIVQLHDLFFSSSFFNKYELLKMSWFLVNSMFVFKNDNNFKS
jgi:hypothetical protein